MKSVTFLDETYTATGKPVTRFVVGVPHQRPAYLSDPELAPPVEEDGDSVIAGDHDLHAAYEVASLDDAMPLLMASDGKGGQMRHQATKIAAMVLEELLRQGVLVLRDTWGEWTDDFQAALAAWREHGGAMLSDSFGERKWYTYDGDAIAEMINEDETPRSATITALQAGGMSEEEIAQEMEGWVD